MADNSFFSRFTFQQIETLLLKISLIKKSPSEINKLLDYVSQIMERDKSILKTSIEQPKAYFYLSNNNADKLENVKQNAIVKDIESTIVFEYSTTWIKSNYIYLAFNISDINIKSIKVNDEVLNFSKGQINGNTLIISKDKISFKNIKIEVALNE